MSQSYVVFNLEQTPTMINNFNENKCDGLGFMEWKNKGNEVICLGIRESAVHSSQMYYKMSSVCLYCFIIPFHYRRITCTCIYINTFSLSFSEL